MPMHLRFKLAGIALTLGGLMAGICHLFSFESSADVSHLAQYARFVEPVYLLLFASLIVVLLGWIEQYSLQSSDSGVTGFAAFVCLFLGILCGDLLHCVLEFSVFPVLGSMVPYALPGIAEATYRSAALGNLIWAGRCLMLFGSVATAMSNYRSRPFPRWLAASFTLSVALLGLGLFPQLAPAMHPASLTAFYISIAALGISFLCTARPRAMRKCKESLAKVAAER
jgi:hypothetical protein